MAHYLSRRTFLKSIGTIAFGAMMPCRLHAKNSERQSPNFVVILTDDQSWVGSSVLMDPGDLRTRSDYYKTPHISRRGIHLRLFAVPHAAACSLAKPRPGTSIKKTRRTGQSNTAGN